MLAKLILFISFSSFASADMLSRTVDTAKLSFKLYVATQAYSNCMYWSLSANGELGQRILMYAAKGMVYPVVPLLGPVLVDSQVDEARQEVERNAQAGDFDLTHSEHYKMLLSTQDYDPTKCQGSFREFRRRLRNYLRYYANDVAKLLKK